MKRALIALVWVCVVAMVACGHDSASTPADAGAGDAAPSAQPSAQELIAAAEQAGTIDHVTALIDLLLAEYDRGALPAELRGPPPTVYHEMTSVMSELQARWSQLSPAQQAIVDPFTRRPDDPKSYWYLGAPATPLPVDGGMAFRDQVEQVVLAPVPGVPIRLWYPQNDLTPSLWQGLRDAIAQSGMYDKEKAIMKGHDVCGHTRGNDTALDVYLLYPGTYVNRHPTGETQDSVPAGYGAITSTEHVATDACDPVPFVLLVYNPNWSADRVPCFHSTMAHELFHAFQATFPAYETETNHWFDEASAKWAEDQVFPTYDCEQSSLPTSKWNRQHAGRLDAYVPISGDAPGPPQYGAYLYPFLLTRMEGDSPTSIGDDWEAMGLGSTALDVLATDPRWDQHFKDFALWNWNRGPAQKYVDHGVPISTDLLKPDAREWTVSASGPKSIDYDLDYTEIQYEHLTVDDLHGLDPQTHAPFISKLSFQLGALHTTPGSVQAIVTIEGQPPVVQDWSGKDEVHFCRDQKEQKITEVVLVLANGGDDMAPRITDTLKVEPQPPCPSGVGAIDYDATAFLDAGGSVTGLSETGSLSYTQHAHADLTNFVTLVNTGTRILYQFQSATSIKFSGGGNFQFTTTTSPVLYTGSETDSVSADGVVHNPPQSGEYDATNTAPAADQLDLHANGDGTYAYELYFASGHLPYSRTLKFHEDELCPTGGDPSGTKSLDSVWDAMSSAIVTTTTTCGGAMSKTTGSDTLITWLDPLDDLASVWSGTYDPRMGDFDVTSSAMTATCPATYSGIGGIDPYWPGDSLPGAPTACSQQANIHVHIAKPPGL